MPISRHRIRWIWSMPCRRPRPERSRSTSSGKRSGRDTGVTSTEGTAPSSTPNDHHPGALQGGSPLSGPGTDKPRVSLTAPSGLPLLSRPVARRPRLAQAVQKPARRLLLRHPSATALLPMLPDRGFRFGTEVPPRTALPSWVHHCPHRGPASPLVRRPKPPPLRVTARVTPSVLRNVRGPETGCKARNR